MFGISNFEKTKQLCGLKMSTNEDSPLYKDPPSAYSITRHTWQEPFREVNKASLLFNEEPLKPSTELAHQGHIVSLKNKILLLATDCLGSSVPPTHTYRRIARTVQLDDVGVIHSGELPQLRGQGTQRGSRLRRCQEELFRRHQPTRTAERRGPGTLPQR